MPTTGSYDPLFVRRLKALETALQAAGLWGDQIATPHVLRPGVYLDASVSPVAVRANPACTPADLAAAEAMLAGWDWVGADDPAETLKSQASAALAASDAFLAVASPTAAQVRDHVRLLARQNTAVIRRLLQLAGL